MRLTGREEAPWSSEPGGIPASASGEKLYTEEKKGGEKSNTCVKCGPSQKKHREKGSAVRVRACVCACVRARERARVPVCKLAADARKGLVSCRKDQKRRAGKSRLTHHTVTCTHSACMGPRRGRE